MGQIWGRPCDLILPAALSLLKPQLYPAARGESGIGRKKEELFLSADWIFQDKSILPWDGAVQFEAAGAGIIGKQQLSLIAKGFAADVVKKAYPATKFDPDM